MAVCERCASAASTYTTVNEHEPAPNLAGLVVLIAAGGFLLAVSYIMERWQ